MSEPCPEPSPEKKSFVPFLLQFRLLKIQSPVDETYWYPGSTVAVSAWTPMALQPGEQASAYLLEDGNPNPLYASPSTTPAPDLQFTLPLPDPDTTYYILVGIFQAPGDVLVVSDLVRVYTVDGVWGSYRRVQY
jgi:hypothetical protein